MAEPRRIAVLGGRFDPPHLGHLMIAQEAWWRLRLDELIFVPVGAPADRPAPQFAGGTARRDGRGGDRRASRLAVLAHRDRPAGSELYGRHAWRNSPRREPQARLWFVMGADRLAGFAAWHEPARILRLARLAVISRGGVDESALRVTADAVAPGRVDVLEAPEVDVSSTMIRERLAAGAPVEYLVPAGVARLLAAAVSDGSDG